MGILLFQALAIINKAAINIDTQVLYAQNISIHLGKYLGVGLLDCWVNV